MVRCPACGAANTEDAKRCAACGERTGRKARSRESVEEGDGPFGRRADARPATGFRAFRCAVWGLIPLAGLLLGPVAVVLAVVAWRQGRRDSAAKGNGYVAAALVLGLLEVLCNCLGVALMVMGLTAS
jgi:hypothetical protein